MQHQDHRDHDDQFGDYCSAKFPKLFGGPAGNLVVACNNTRINNPLSVLWDYQYDKVVDPFTVTLNDIDELLQADGNFRFRCNFGGRDDMHNKYIEHPYGRFKPLNNYCARLVFGAHDHVKTIFSKDDNGFSCDCGEHRAKRLKNLIENDKTSQCSYKVFKLNILGRHRIELTIPYKCFTVNSPITDVGKYMPCPPAQFTSFGSQMHSVTIVYSAKENIPIEHPKYTDFIDMLEFLEGVWIST